MALGVSVGCRTSEHESGSFLIETRCLLSFSLHRPVRVQSTRDTVGLDALVEDRKGTIFRPVLEKACPGVCRILDRIPPVRFYGTSFGMWRWTLHPASKH